jgi:hypothetical protein
MIITLGWKQRLTLTAIPKTKRGKEVAVENPAFETAASEHLLVTPAPDGLSLTIQSGPQPEDNPVQIVEGFFTCDADLGGGVRQIESPFEIHIVPDEADEIELQPSTPEDME